MPEKPIKVSFTELCRAMQLARDGGFARIILVVDHQGQVRFRPDMPHKILNGFGRWTLPLIDRHRDNEDIAVIAALWAENQLEAYPAPTAEQDGIEVIFDDEPDEEILAEIGTLSKLTKITINPSFPCAAHSQPANRALCLMPEQAYFPGWLTLLWPDESILEDSTGYLMVPLCPACEKTLDEGIENAAAIAEAARLTGWTGNTAKKREEPEEK